MLYNKNKLANPGNEKLFNEDRKIVLQRIRNLSLKRRLIAAIDNEKRYLLKTASIHPRDPLFSTEYLIALINSKLYNYYFSKLFVDFTIKKGYLERLPISKATQEQQITLKTLVTKIVDYNKRLNEIGDKKTDERVKIDEEIKKTDKEVTTYFNFVDTYPHPFLEILVNIASCILFMNSILSSIFRTSI